jgi:hypothetical protein
VENIWVAVSGWSGWAVVAAVLYAIWLQVRKDVFAALGEWAATQADARKRALLVSLVRAMEQLYGEQPAGDAATAAALGEQKMTAVLTEAAKAGVDATTTDVEGAVHEVKAQVKAARSLATATAGELLTALGAGPDDPFGDK